MSISAFLCLTLLSDGFSESSGRIHILPTRTAFSILCEAQRACTRRLLIPHLVAASWAEMYSIKSPLSDYIRNKE